MDLPAAIKAKLQQEGYTAHTGVPLEYATWVIEEALPLDPTGHLVQ